MIHLCILGSSQTNITESIHDNYSDKISKCIACESCVLYSTLKHLSNYLSVVHNSVSSYFIFLIMHDQQIKIQAICRLPVSDEDIFETVEPTSYQKVIVAFCTLSSITIYILIETPCMTYIYIIIVYKNILYIRS